jgi:RND family efflux transporter MFP subunit
MKYLKIIITLVVIGGVVFLGYNQLQKNKEIIDENAELRETVIAEIPVTIALAQMQKIEDKLEVVGTFEARKELSAIAESQGRITNLYIEEGQSISKGKVIATIDDATIQSQLKTAQSSLEKSKKDVERYKNLLNVGAISQTQYEEVQLGMQNQQSNITALEQQLKYTSARAPMSGIVKEVKLEQGSFANPGVEIATIVDISKLNMIVKVDEKDVVKIKRNQKVAIETEVYPNQSFSGRITQIGVQADVARKYEVSIEVANSSKYPLKAGMYGTVAIQTAQKQIEKLVIPRKSVVGSLKQPQVYLARNGKATLTDIQVGETIEDNVVVLNGLSEGDQIITTGQINLDNGRAIKVVNQNISQTTANK